MSDGVLIYTKHGKYRVATNSLAGTWFMIRKLLYMSFKVIYFDQTFSTAILIINYLNMTKEPILIAL
mgnify:FL=1